MRHFLKFFVVVVTVNMIDVEKHGAVKTSVLILTGSNLHSAINRHPVSCNTNY